MSVSLERIIRNKGKKTCMVVGDIMVDKYVYGRVERISPEAPIPVVAAKDTRYVLGGAANVAGNIKGLHVNAILCGVIGNDTGGDTLINELRNHNITFAGYRSNNRCTTVKTRVVGMNQQLVRVDREDKEWLAKDEEECLVKAIKDNLSKVDYVILSDYNKGVCSESLCKSLIKLCKECDKKLIVDPKCSDWTKYKGSYLITPNFKEFCEAIGQEIDNDEKGISDKANGLMNRYELSQILITRSQYGMTIVGNDRKPLTFKARQQEVFDVSGAGDTVIAVLTASLALGYELDEAVELSNQAAGVAVSKPGTYMVTLEDLIGYLSGKGSSLENKIISDADVETVVSAWKRSGEKIVFTNGCFDILHIGHVDYLNRAGALGTKLIVGLNSDDSVRRLKGEKRPVNGQRERALMLAALRCVDAVVIFDEDTPEELVKKIEPDYLVKGGDYAIEDIAGRNYAKEVLTIPLTEGYSTTSMIEKIKEM